MAEGIDISLFDDDGGGGGETTGGFTSESQKTLEEIWQEIHDMHWALKECLEDIEYALTGGGGEGSSDGVGAAAGGGKGLGGMFSSALGKAGIYLAVFNQAVQGVQRAFGMLQQALSKFADVNAVVAIAFERLQLFLRGVLVVLSEALAPALSELTDIFKELIASLVAMFVEIFVLFRPVIMEILDGLKRLVQWFNRLLGVRPLDIEEQGLRRSATGVANIISQFANAAANPQGQPAVNVNIQGNDTRDWEQMMNDAITWGKQAASTEMGDMSPVAMAGAAGGIRGVFNNLLTRLDNI